MAKPEKIYWDTCAFIGLLNGEVDKKRELEIVYGAARQGNIEIWTSTLSMIECRRLKTEEHSPKPLDQENNIMISDLFKQSFIKPIPMAVDIAENARTLWRDTKGLGKYQDAIHLASAIRWNIKIMHTYDYDDLLHLSEKLRCQNDELLVICYPDNTTDGPLFAKPKQNPT